MVAGGWLCDVFQRSPRGTRETERPPLCWWVHEQMVRQGGRMERPGGTHVCGDWSRAWKWLWDPKHSMWAKRHYALPPTRDYCRGPAAATYPHGEPPASRDCRPEAPSFQLGGYGSSCMWRFVLCQRRGGPGAEKYGLALRRCGQELHDTVPNGCSLHAGGAVSWLECLAVPSRCGWPNRPDGRDVGGSWPSLHFDNIYLSRRGADWAAAVANRRGGVGTCAPDYPSAASCGGLLSIVCPNRSPQSLPTGRSTAWAQVRHPWLVDASEYVYPRHVCCGLLDTLRWGSWPPGSRDSSALLRGPGSGPNREPLRFDRLARSCRVGIGGGASWSRIILRRGHASDAHVEAQEADWFLGICIPGAAQLPSLQDAAHDFGVFDLPRVWWRGGLFVCTAGGPPVLFAASAGHSQSLGVVDWAHSVGADAGALFVEVGAVSSLRSADASVFMCREGMCDEPVLSICEGPPVCLHQTRWWSGYGVPLCYKQRMGWVVSRRKPILICKQLRIDDFRWGSIDPRDQGNRH